MSGVVVGVVTEQPGASEGLEGLAAPSSSSGAGMRKMTTARCPSSIAEINRETMVRVALGKLVDELVQTNASSGTLAISCWSEMRGGDRSSYEVTVWGFPGPPARTTRATSGTVRPNSRRKRRRRKLRTQPASPTSRASSTIWETKTRLRSTVSRCRAEASTQKSGSVVRLRPRRRSSTPARGARAAEYGRDLGRLFGRRVCMC